MLRGTMLLRKINSVPDHFTIRNRSVSSLREDLKDVTEKTLMCGLFVILMVNIVYSSILVSDLESRETFRDVAFTSQGRGVIVGDSGCLFCTGNGGENWKSNRIENAPWLKSLQLSDSGVGWAVGMFGTLLKTYDSFQSWQTVPTFVDNNFHTCFSRYDSVCLVGGSDGIIMATYDGGATWHRTNENLGKTIYGMTFIDDSTGIAVGQSGLMLRTTDSGRTWEIISSDSLTGYMNLYGVHFFNQSCGIAYGANSTLLISKNSGDSDWHRLRVGQNNMAIRDVCICDTATFIAVGDSGRILATADGGEHWTVRSITPRIELWGIARLQDSTFFVVGSNGTNATINLVTGIEDDSVKIASILIDGVSYDQNRLTKAELFENEFGKLLGKAYVDNPLGEGLSGIFDQDPRFDMDHVDCVTAVEQSMASAICRQPDTFLETMDRIRYSGGRVSYLSRNHFFVPDWIPSNSWLIEDVTTNIGDKYVERLSKTIGRQKFLSYINVTIPQVEDNDMYETYYIPSENIENILHRIDKPLIVIFLGHLDWLFARHTGMVFRDQESDELILRHASSVEKRVVEQPFGEYIQNAKKIAGIKLLSIMN